MTIQLRGGFVTEDPRLDRIPDLAPENRNYLMREVLDDPKARLSVENLRAAAGKYVLPGPTLDQRNEGQCVSDATHDAANGAPARLKPPVTVFEDRREAYHQMQHDDPWAGCYLGGGCPIAPDPANAYGGTSVLAGARYGQRMGYWREYRWIGAGSGRLEDDLIGTLRAGFGIVFGIPWLNGMYETSPDGLVTVTGDVVGGHAIHGWEWAPRQRMPRHWQGTRPGVWWHNSWGPQAPAINGGYGVKRRGRTGCGFILLDDLLGLLERRGEGMVPIP